MKDYSKGMRDDYNLTHHTKRCLLPQEGHKTFPATDLAAHPHMCPHNDGALVEPTCSSVWMAANKKH